jgi:hypothetical protein
MLAAPAATRADQPGWLELNPARHAADVEVPSGFTLAQEEPMESSSDVTMEETTVTTEEESSMPFSVSLSYYLYSDYVFRFVNFSEYGTEGREKPNHQLTTDFSFDLGDFGSVGFATFFEWYAAQRQVALNPETGGANIQEIDYSIYWSYSLEAIYTDLTLGYTFYTFPNAKVFNSSEWFFSLEHNDAWMWKGLLPENEDGVLNPSFFFAHDVDALGGVWMEFAFSHTFDVFENFTITPGWLVAIDGCYLRDNTFRFAGDQWSLVMEYDLGSLMQIPEWAGSLAITGELYWNNPWGNVEDTGIAQDVFWGGMGVHWSWPG